MSNLKLEFVIEAIDNATKKVRDVNAAVDKAAEPMRRLRASSRDLFQEAGWGKLQKQMETIRERGSALVGTVKGIAVGFAGVTAAAGAAFFAIKRNIDGIDNAGDQAAKLGISVEVFQRMAYLAKLNGSNEEEMAGALQHLARSAGEAAGGSKEMQQWFARAGISMAKLKTMNVAQMWEAIGDKFQAVGDQGQNARKKLEFLMAVTGRSSAGLVQVANLGAEGMRKFYEEADRLGVVIDGATAGAMSDFNHNFDRLTFSIRGVVSMIAKYALPAFDSMVRKFTDLNVASRQEIGEKLGRMVGDLVTKLPGFLASLGQITKTTAKLATETDKVAQAMGGWQNVLTAIAAILGARVMVQLFAFVAAVASAIPTVLAIAKLVWWLAAGFLSVVGWPALVAAALVAAAVAIWAYWEPIGDFFASLWESIKKIGGGMVGMFGFGTTPSSIAQAPVPSAIATGRSPSVDGRLDIHIDSEGKAGVANLRKSPDSMFDLNVYSGGLLGLN